MCKPIRTRNITSSGQDTDVNACCASNGRTNRIVRPAKRRVEPITRRLHHVAAVGFDRSIEGSTHLWERHPEAMKSVLARHDEVFARKPTDHTQQGILETTHRTSKRYENNQRVRIRSSSRAICRVHFGERVGSWDRSRGIPTPAQRLLSKNLSHAASKSVSLISRRVGSWSWNTCRVMFVSFQNPS